MIIRFDELKKYRRQVAMVDGAFDPLHQGHIEYFRQARELGVPLLCNIAPDSYLVSKHPPLLTASHRAQIIDALSYIDVTHISTGETERVLSELQPTHFIKGKDWEGRLPVAQTETCREQGTQLVFLNTMRESSSKILTKYQSQPLDGAVSKFEALVFTQGQVPAAHYDADYFVTDWRDADNAYTIESRRRIEGRHPEVIKEVFLPRQVLDVGCGPGTLLYLLEEQGIVADGVDFSASALELAPSGVRDRIRVGTVGDRSFVDNAYDLVICREVFEHLTVLQVREAVRNICRISSKYVYVTTRFHERPNSLLDVTTQFDVDPTHITLLNKDFLRVLFILEGFRCRPDLEARIDWMGKGRVLVYEQPVLGTTSER